MKNKRVAKVWSKRHLPTDLWPLILCRVPVKSLLRFRCVSKSWLSLIDDPNFARLHLKSFKNNLHETNLLVVHGVKKKCVIRCSNTFRANSTLLGNFGMKGDSGTWYIVGSLDGLVVLKSGLTNGMKVWNPSIRKFHEFQSFPEIEKSRGDWITYQEIGLGYDLLAKVYKHVRLIFVSGIIHSVAVYTLDDKSWKIIQFQGKGCSEEQWRPGGFNCKKAVYFQGSLYFIADFMPIRTLLSFDMSSGVFSAVSVPDDDHAFRSSIAKGYSTLRLIDNGRSLAVFHLAPFEKSVWVSETSRERSCWTKRYSLDSSLDWFLCFYHKMNGDTLTFGKREEVFTDEMGNVERVWWDQVLSYSPESGDFKILKQSKYLSTYISHLCGYVESLILP